MRTVVAALSGLLGCGLAGPAVNESDGSTTDLPTGSPHSTTDGSSSAPAPSDAANEASTTALDATDSGALETSTSGTTSTGNDDASADEPLEPGPPFALTDLDAPHQVVLGVKGPGQAWADVDGDGWLDLVTVGGMAPTRLWINQGDGSFAPSPLFDPYASVLETIGATLADYDNDGDPDLLLLRYGPNLLLRNDGPLGWVDVSTIAGIDHSARPASAAWGDYDGDAWLDLYVANGGGEMDLLYHNEGDGTFTEATSLLPGRGSYATYGVAFADLDNDGDPDLYVANDKKVGNLLWRNDGPGCGGWCFANVGRPWGAAIKVDSMGVAVGDYDNDNDLDLSVTDNHRHNIVRNTLELGTPGFVDVSAAVGVIFDAYGWGTIFFDYDNDGWLDLYVADARLGPGMSSHLFHNELATFVDVTAGCGCAEPGWTHGVSHADYDHDGAVDFIVGNRGVRHELYRNRNISGHHWLTIELHGAGPVNRDAVGARVWVATESDRLLMREVELGSSVASQNSPRLHFGLGSEHAAGVLIRWPDGLIEVPPTPATDSLWVHTYPE